MLLLEFLSSRTTKIGAVVETTKSTTETKKYFQKYVTFSLALHLQQIK
jgi:hypothetical protein